MRRLGGSQQGDLLKHSDIPHENHEFMRTAFRITPELKKALTLELVHSGYGIKGKSKWIIEAMRSMLDDPRYASSHIYHAQILEFAHMRQANAADSVNLPYPIWVHAWHSMLDTMKYGASIDPPEYVEVTISDVLHIVILNRLSACTVHGSDK